MFGLVFLLLIVVPVVELYVLIQVAGGLGWLPSILLLLAISAVGGTLMRWQTAGAVGRIRDRIAKGEMPSKELADGGLMIFGGALLLTPGFFTDAVGLAMFIPPTRAIARTFLLKRFGSRITTMKTSSGPGGFAFGSSFGGSNANNASTRPYIDVDEVQVDRIPNTELPADE